MQEKDIHLPSIYRIPESAETAKSGNHCAVKVPKFETENCSEQNQFDYELSASKL
jgi:hypothetical protein